MLVDSISSDNVIFEARTESDAPEVDGRVYVEMNPPFIKGGRGILHYQLQVNSEELK